MLEIQTNQMCHSFDIDPGHMSLTVKILIPLFHTNNHKLLQSYEGAIENLYHN